MSVNISLTLKELRNYIVMIASVTNQPEEFVQYDSVQYMRMKEKEFSLLRILFYIKPAAAKLSMNGVRESETNSAISINRHPADV